MKNAELRKRLIPLAGIAIFIAACLFVPKFASFTNIINILRQSSYTAIPAVMMTAIIITGGINLSLGGVMSLAGVACALLINHEVSIPIAFLIVDRKSVV